MKTKLFISMLFCSMTYISLAQFNTEPENNKNKWQIGININTVEPINEPGFDHELDGRALDAGHEKDNSYCLGASLSYKLKGNCSVRLLAQMTNYDIHETRDTREELPFSSNQYDLYDMRIKESVLNISPGVLWAFHYKIINPYGGFQLVYKRYNAITNNSQDMYYDTSNNFLNGQKFTIKNDGGFSLGVGPFLGFSINVFKNICIGVEFSSAFAYYKTGGEISTISTNLPSNYTGTSTFQETFEGYKFSSVISSFNISINF